MAISSTTRNLDEAIDKLLKIDSPRTNKLIDLYAGESARKNEVYFLSRKDGDVAPYVLNLRRQYHGTFATTVLSGSSLSPDEEQIVGHGVNTLDWVNSSGGRDVKKLHDFVKTAYEKILGKGNNPLFLSVGALVWNIPVKEGGEITSKTVTTPFLIFPVRLVRGPQLTPLSLEFVEEEVYINPCFVKKLGQINPSVAKSLPLPDGCGDWDDPIDTDKFGTGEEYFERLERYIESCSLADDGETVFRFERNKVAISSYDHGDICMYYDIRRNRDRIYEHPLVGKIFGFDTPSDAEAVPSSGKAPLYILPYDSVQEDIVKEVVAGKSMVIKGPPGTGKTLTIANMIAALLAEGKSVLLSSQKLAALSEVNAKLPEELRKFVLLLESETEKQALSQSPDALKLDLKNLLRACKEYTPDPHAERAARSIASERASLFAWLHGYRTRIFDTPVAAFKNYYEALDTYLKTNTDIFPFATPGEVLKVDESAYYEITSKIEAGADLLDRLSANGSHLPALSPWFGLPHDGEVDIEAALRDGIATAALITSLSSRLAETLAPFSMEPESLTLWDTAALALAQFSKEELISLSAMEAPDKETAVLKEAHRAVSAAKKRNSSPLPAKAELTEEALAAHAKEADRLTLDGTLTVADTVLYRRASEILGSDPEFLKPAFLSIAANVAEEIETLKKESELHLLTSLFVFRDRSTLTEEDFTLIGKSYEALQDFCENPADKYSPLNFKVKGAHKKLLPLLRKADTPFRKLTEAVKEYHLFALCRERIVEAEERLSEIFRRPLEVADLSALKRVFSKCRELTEEEKASYLASVFDGLSGFEALLPALTLPEREVTVEEVLSSILAEKARRDLEREVETFSSRYGIKTALSAEEFARSLRAVADFMANYAERLESRELLAELILSLENTPAPMKDDLRTLLFRLMDFGKDHFPNYYSRSADRVTFGALTSYCREIDDRGMIASALAYSELLAADAPLSVEAYFNAFAYGKLKLPEGIRHKEFFEHTFAALAIEGYLSTLGNDRYSFAAEVEKKLCRITELEKQACAWNVKEIEARAVASLTQFIKLNEAAGNNVLNFIGDRNLRENLRLLFKKHAKALLALKRCFILSPSTASLLFRPEDYSHFDVLIVDEASQLPPAVMLPVLFRSKQCVIVGDEWQMPPITHFEEAAVEGDHAESDEAAAGFEPEISALTAALRSEALPVKELVCHYRSRTESLIAFSQGMFYPNMRTFPSPLPRLAPKAGVTGLGFRDVLVENGYSERGQNPTEAAAAVAALNEHFDHYFDETTGKLSLSVGIIAFGVAQVDLIKSYVAKDKALTRRIERALESFDDLPDKLLFFRTIESVQGQEAGHVILSLTYGLTPNGVRQSFGQMNQGKFGMCIFNVAVTRAQSMVTCIHSVTAEQITNANIAYISRYLSLVRRFSETTENPFFGTENKSGFLSVLAKTLVELGVARDRIVLDYGVTEGSVKLPLAILSKEKDRALLGIFAETPYTNRYHYLDYICRYVNNFSIWGWQLYRIFIHEWVTNGKAEKERLKARLASIPGIL